MGWFGGYEVSQDVQDWIEANFDWAERVGIFRQDTPLVLPTKEFFPAPKGDTHQVVTGLVGNLKTILGLQGLEISLARSMRCPRNFGTAMKAAQALRVPGRAMIGAG